MDLTDKRLWRKALALVHPDQGGDEEVFKFLSEVKEKLEEQDPTVKRITGKGKDKKMTIPTPPVGTRPWWEHFRR